MQASLNLTPLQPKAKIFKLENVQDKEFKDCNQQDIYMDTSSGLGWEPNFINLFYYSSLYMTFLMWQITLMQ